MISRSHMVAQRVQTIACPDDNMLIELVEGLLAPADQAAIEDHVDRCARCLEALAGFARGDGPERADADRDAAARVPRGARVGRYVILDVIGAGAMATVYAARDPELEREVALKWIHPRHAANPETRARVMREARALARLAHPNVVTVHDVGVVDVRGDATGADEAVFVVMERVDGATLSAWRASAIAASTADGREALRRVFFDVARGLAAAHAVGIVHRDVKPDNILVGRDGRARIGDFGLARADVVPPAERPGAATVRAASITVDGAVVGTPAYMALEQLRGEPCDARVDQFAFCATLYEAWHGRRPFEGDTTAALAASIASGQLRRPADMPDALWHAVSRGLAASPAQRHATMAPLIAVLETPFGSTDRSAQTRAIGTLTGIAAALVALAAACTPWVSVGFLPRTGLQTADGVWVASIAVAALITGLVRPGARPGRVVGLVYLCGGVTGGILTGLDLRAIQRVIPDNLTALVAPRPGLLVAFAALVILALAGAALVSQAMPRIARAPVP